MDQGQGGDGVSEEIRGELLALQEQHIESLSARILELESALRKIYEYRSNKPDWNMIMAIAGSAIAPCTLEPQDAKQELIENES